MFAYGLHNYFLNLYNNASAMLYQNLIAYDRWRMILDGLVITLQITAGAAVLGIIIGLILTFMRLSGIRVLELFAQVYISVIRGTPVITQLLILNFTIFAGMRGVGVLVGIVGFGINSGAYVCEIIRAGILSVDKGQSEAGRSLGLSSRQTMSYIVMPQAIKNIIPTLANESIILFKETSIVGIIGVADITRVSQQIMSRTFNVTPMFVAAIIYFVIVAVMTFFLSRLEKKLRESDVR